MSSAKRKIARRRATVTVTADDLLILDEDGEEFAPRAGEWVKFRRKVPLKLLRAAGAMSAEGAALADQVDGFRDLVDILNSIIVDWNWSDEDAEPGEDGRLPVLPLPRDDPEVLWRLDQDEVMYLVEALMDRVAAAPNPSSSP